MITCPKCGRTTRNTEKCERCGYELSVKERNPALTRCTACKEWISKKALTCPYCGEPTPKAIRQNIENATKKKEDAQRENNIKISMIFDWILIGIGALLALSQFIVMQTEIGKYYGAYKGSLSNHEQTVVILLIFGVAMIIIGLAGLWGTMFWKNRRK